MDTPGVYAQHVIPLGQIVCSVRAHKNPKAEERPRDRHATGPGRHPRGTLPELARWVWTFPAPNLGEAPCLGFLDVHEPEGALPTPTTFLRLAFTSDESRNMVKNSCEHCLYLIA